MRRTSHFIQRLTLIALLVGLAAPALAQSEAVIRGQVVAVADGAPLADGAVTLRSVTNGAVTNRTTDASGRFSFAQVSPGEYVLSGHSQGFTLQEMRLTVEPRETRSVTLALALQGVTVNVRVTADAPALPGTHSPSSTVLTASRIEELPISQRTTLPDALVTTTPGLIRGHDDFVHIRGEEVALNPILNGVAFWENPHAIFSAGFSPDVIETANIMTGGFPAEYGNRFGGVVDVVTKSGLRMERSGSVVISGGDAGRRSIQGDFGGHTRRLGYYAFGSTFVSDRFLSPPAPDARHDHARGGHAFVQLDGEIGGAGLLRAVLMGDGATFEIPVTPDDLEVRPDALASQRTRQQTATLGWTRAGSDLTTALSFYQRWSRSTLLPAQGPLTARARVARSVSTVGVKGDVTKLAARHTLKAGLDVVRLRPVENLNYEYGGFRELSHLKGLPHIHITNNVITFAGRESGGEVSAYVQDNLQISDRVTADVGLRVDRYRLGIAATHVSPRVNLAVRLGEATVGHASYNAFFVPPPIEGILSSAAGLTARIGEIAAPLPPVQATTARQVEAGVSTMTGPARVGLTGYYRASDNPVHTVVWPDSRIYSYTSFDRARAYGVEAKAEIPTLARRGMTGYVNYALGRVYFHNPVTGGFVTEVEHLRDASRFLAPMDQTHTLTAGFSYRHQRSGLFAGTNVEYGSGTPRGHGADEHGHETDEDAHAHLASASDASRVPGHLTTNLSFGVTLRGRTNRQPGFAIQVDAENIANRSYLIAQEGEFTPGQYSARRLLSVTAKIRF